MGLAILPPRLTKELAKVEAYLLGNTDSVDPKHKIWADRLKHEETFNADNVAEVVEQSVGQIFKRVLEDAGVFKNSEAGQAGLKKFIEQLTTN